MGGKKNHPQSVCLLTALFNIFHVFFL